MRHTDAWLQAHEQGVPTALVGHMRRAVAPHDGPSDVADVLGAAASDVLARALSANPMTRAQALDVLAADALLTYAFEAAAADPQRLAARADVAMQRVAALAEEPQ